MHYYLADETVEISNEYARGGSGSGKWQVASFLKRQKLELNPTTVIAPGMVKARANRAMRRNSQLKNQLRNPWSISGSTNPDFISVNAEAAPVPKDHIPRTTEKQKDGFRHRALRPPVMPGDFGMEMIPKKLATSERISPKSVPLPRY